MDENTHREVFAKDEGILFNPKAIKHIIAYF
jgi:hypothetical protein